MSDTTHGRLPPRALKPFLPRPRKKKFALLLSNHQIHRLCRRMARSFQ